MKTMTFDEVKIIQVKGHYEVYTDGKFFCSADSYIEAINELYKVYK